MPWMLALWALAMLGVLAGRRRAERRSRAWRMSFVLLAAMLVMALAWAACGGGGNFGPNSGGGTPAGTYTLTLTGTYTYTTGSGQASTLSESTPMTLNVN